MQPHIHVIFTQTKLALNSILKAGNFTLRMIKINTSTGYNCCKAAPILRLPCELQSAWETASLALVARPMTQQICFAPN